MSNIVINLGRDNRLVMRHVMKTCPDLRNRAESWCGTTLFRYNGWCQCCRDHRATTRLDGSRHYVRALARTGICSDPEHEEDVGPVRRNAEILAATSGFESVTSLSHGHWHAPPAPPYANRPDREEAILCRALCLQHCCRAAGRAAAKTVRLRCWLSAG